MCTLSFCPSKVATFPLDTPQGPPLDPQFNGKSAYGHDLAADVEVYLYHRYMDLLRKVELCLFLQMGQKLLKDTSLKGLSVDQVKTIDDSTHVSQLIPLFKARINQPHAPKKPLLMAFVDLVEKKID